MLAELIGHYRVVATLGTGGMGVVWKAIDTRLNRPVALKAIRETDPANTEAVLRLRAEALAAASLDHPYICKIYELLETGTATIVVMEFVDGETLGDIIGRALPPLVDVLRYGSEIAEGLANAHARGIVHRDVKPSNVMVTPHGHIKLLDFGIARITSDMALTESGLTLPGNIPGTPQYMSPEQALGRPLDGRADLFSLGILLFRCLTGQLPFEGQTRDEYVQEMLAGRTRSIETLAPQVPEPVRDIVKACLQRDPAFRPESAAVVAETLRRSAEALSTGTVPIAISRSRGLPRWALQMTALAAVLGVVVLGAMWLRPAAEDTSARTLVPAVTWPSSESEARVSPDGNWLSFISDRQNQSRIFVQRIDGGEPVAVRIQGAALSHAWSPDSRNLAVLVRQGESQFLIVVPAFFGGSPGVSIPLDSGFDDVGVLRWVGNGLYLDVNRGDPGRSLLHVDLASRKIDDVSARWSTDLRFRNIDVSPDGRRVVIAGPPGDRLDLWIAGIDGSGVRKLIDDAYMDRYPLWVDVETIAFLSNRGGQLDLWRVSVTTGKLTQVTSGQPTEIPTGASQDGSVIAFQETANRVNLWRFDIPSGAVRQLTDDALSDFWPSVSEDDGSVAFQRTRPTLVEGFQFFDSRIQVARITGNAALEPQAVADGFGARLSADGRWVAYYQRTADPAHLRLLAKNLATGEARTLSEQCVLPRLSATSLPIDFIEQNATWSASGSMLYYIVAGMKGDEIHAANLDAPKEPSRSIVAAGAGGMRDLRLSPDGGILAFLVRTTKPGSDQPVFELRAHHLREERTAVLAREQQRQPFLNLPGWSRPDAVILQRAAPTSQKLFELQLVEVALDGARRVVGTVPDSPIPAVRADVGRGRLFVIRSADGIHNLHAMSLRDGVMRQVTSNESPGVSFSGIHPMRADALLYGRDERKRDIWLVTTGARPAQ